MKQTRLKLLECLFQGVLEFKYPDTKFHIIVDEGDREYDLFAHGGMLFWFASSIFFFVVSNKVHSSVFGV